MVAHPLPQVDLHSPVPRYVQAKTILIDAIRRGTFPRGSKLPSTSEIGQSLAVSLITAHKAIQCLVAEGWLDRVRGRGTFVRDDFEASVAAKACHRVGLLLDAGIHLGDYYHGALLHGLREAACSGDPGVELFIQRQNSPAAIPNLLADGFICLHPPYDTFAMLEAVAKNTPIVVLGGSTGDTSLYCVDSENEAGTREAVRHLAELGHRDIAIVNGRLSATNSLHRFNGYLAEMRERELPIRDEYVLTSEKAEMTPGTRSALIALLRGSLRPTAIVAAGYLLALEVLEVARNLGLRIPNDLSLVAFDDPRSAALLNPPLTTVRQPLETMARLAMERMIALINKTSPEPRVQFLPTRLVVRESTTRLPIPP
jgi:GntR family transcriptional regulator of arabinose operon